MIAQTSHPGQGHAETQPCCAGVASTDRPALLRTLTGPSTGHHSHPIPTPGCAACALVVITRATPVQGDGPGEGSAEAVHSRRSHMSNVPQDHGTNEVLLGVARDLEDKAAKNEHAAQRDQSDADAHAEAARIYRGLAARQRSQAAEIRAMVALAKVATEAVQGVPDGDA